MARDPKRARMSRRARRLVVLLICFSLGATLIAVAMALSGSVVKDTLWFEIGKLVAQLGLLTGFGAIVTLLVYEFQRDQEEAQLRVADEQRRAEARREWLRSILTRSSTAYTDLKQARRTMQAAIQSSGAVAGGVLRPDVYYDQMAGISEVQTDFEQLVTEVRSYEPQDATQRVEAEVAGQMRLISGWLSRLVTEWKDHPEPPEGVPSSPVAVAEMQNLRLFLARSEDSDAFTHGFGEIKSAYKRVERAIWRQLTQAPSSDNAH